MAKDADHSTKWPQARSVPRSQLPGSLQASYNRADMKFFSQSRTRNVNKRAGINKPLMTVEPRDRTAPTLNTKSRATIKRHVKSQELTTPRSLSVGNHKRSTRQGRVETWPLTGRSGRSRRLGPLAEAELIELRRVPRRRLHRISMAHPSRSVLFRSWTQASPQSGARLSITYRQP